MQSKNCGLSSPALERMDKMRCQRIQPHLLALVEGELKQRKREKVARHVAACPACASAMRSLRQTLRVVQTIEVPEPSPAFWQEFGTALHQRIRREEAAHQGRRRGQLWELFRLPKPALAAVAVSLILVCSLPFLGGRPGQQRIPRMVVAGGDEVSLATNLDFLKHLDLLEEVDVLEQLDPSP
jgi:anti-sigma factor RsiW